MYFCLFLITQIMTIKILFFGITSDLMQRSSMEIEFQKNTSVNDLKLFLIEKNQNLKNIDEFAIAVNEEYANNDLMLNNNDIVAIIPPVSGG